MIRVWQRPVVAHAAGEHVIHAVADALVHHARGEHALLDRRPQAARSADGVDGPHVVAVAPLDRFAGVEVHAERGPKERLLDVVNRQGVTGQQHIDESGTDQLLEVGRSARMNDDGTGDDDDPSARGLYLAHHRRDTRHADLDAALGGDLGGHEREAVPIPLLKFRHHAHTGYAAHNAVALDDVAELPA